MKTLLLVALLMGTEGGAPSGEAISAIKSQLAPFQTIRGNFAQRKIVKFIRKPLLSSGTFLLTKGKGLLWCTEKPFDATLRIDPSGIVELKDGKVEPIVSTSEQPGMKKVGELLFSVFSGDLQLLDSQFTFENVQAPSGMPWSAVLRPRDPNVARFVASVTLHGQKTVQSLSLIETNGDTTEIHFDNINLDVPPSATEAAHF